MIIPERFRPGREIGWAAGQYEDRTAVVFGDEALSFRQLDRRCNRFANALLGLGLEKNDRIGTLMPNGPHSLEVVSGIAKSGLASVALNARHTAREHRAILEDCAASAVVVGHGLEAVIEEAAAGMAAPPLVISLGELAPGWHAYDALMDKAADSQPDVWVGSTDIVRIQYTSGSTGKPKGVIHDQAAHFGRLVNFFMALEYALGTGHTMIHTGPLTHAAGNYALPYLMRGAQNVVLPHFDPELLVHTVANTPEAHLLLVPTMISRVVEYLDVNPRTLPTLTRINYGTAPINRALLRRGLEHLGPIFRQHYGLTEAAQPLTLLLPEEHVADGPERLTRRLASCGRTTVNVNLAIRHEDGAECPSGTVGEITLEATGPIATRYWRQPEAEQAAYRDGWLWTGDLGYRDEDGFVYIVGRSKDMIITGGFNVYAREVEQALADHPAVLDVAVYGIPDTEWGERIVAAVTLKPGAAVTEMELVGHCRTQIAGYKVPRLIEFLNQLPKNAAGKLDKVTMRRDTLARLGLAAEPGVLARYR
ncbi:MAG: AMP-binding protein [Azospirillaceae bacterium]